MAQAAGLHFFPTPQRVLITGGTGFIGSALCKALLADGHSVTVLTRNPGKAQAVLGSQVVTFSNFDALSVQSAFDVVINLAGEPVVGPRWTAARKAVLLASRSGVTDALVAWLQRAHTKPRLMISGSAIGFYGVQAQGDRTELAEDAAPQAIFMSELCQAWEASAKAVQAMGVPLALLRIGVVLGPCSTGQGALPKMVLPLRLGVGGQLGNGQQVVSWVHLADVLGAVAHLMRLPAMQAQGVYNLTAPQACSQHMFMQVAAQAMHRSWALPLPTPAWVLRVLMGEQAGLLLEGQRVAPTRLLGSGYRFAYGDVAAALKHCLAS
ncbi:TIGR01777 family oxidoreductase [Rhodoferax aquaticus]|uniref:TIGR01777 family protein n=1 Tax=Rhodoferax aquaticus TaxID=2527691 RepID=A0A515ERS5_9BURK|nr:TIGR01777 family oxidoreductase [Rhodoferax aquaticus]QDL55350.1 TIGR01777 family protein [Rhodoferax aquaticus]